MENGKTFIHLRYSYGYGNIGGLRGLVERNTMRYYAAIEAFLGARSGSVQARFEKRIRDWHAMTELFPRQLHELEREEYLDMKRMENLRDQDYDRPRS